MKLLTILLASIILSASLVSWVSAAETDIEFIIDSSGSMAALTEGTSQIDIAKKSIKSTITTIPSNVSVALRAYGHRVPKSDKKASCKDSELLVPFGPLNTASFNAKVDALSPNGYSPIAYSLKEAAKDFLGKESQYVVILLSDGEETCGGDPVAEAKNLLTQGFKVIIHTIGFRVDAATRAQLTAISTATGGLYFDAKDSAALTKTLEEATQKALLIAKSEEMRGGEVRGGNGYEDAVLLKAGLEYRLDHHQRTNEYDYFYVPLKKAQSLTVGIATLAHGIDIYKDGTVTENNNPYAGFRIVGPDLKAIISGIIIGTLNGKNSKEAIASQDGKYYVLIGNEYHNQHKNSPFSLELKEYFDVNTGTDAGDNFTQATKIKLGEYPKNWLIYENDKDVYQLEGKAGKSYTIKINPPNPGASFKVSVYDQDRVQLAYQYSPNKGAVVRLENIALKASEPFYVQVERYYSFERPLEYALSVQKAGAAVDKAAPDSAGEAEAEKAEVEKKTNFLPWIIVVILLAALAFVGWKYRSRV